MPMCRKCKENKAEEQFRTGHPKLSKNCITCRQYFADKLKQSKLRRGVMVVPLVCLICGRTGSGAAIKDTGLGTLCGRERRGMEASDTLGDLKERYEEWQKAT